MADKEFAGALPSQHIRKLIRDGHVIGADEKNIQPASLDLTVGDRIWRVPHRLLPNPGETVEGLAERFGAEPWSFGYPLEIDVLYLVKLEESLRLPSGVYGYANPKSSSGRLDFHVTMLADGIRRFDSAGVSGYRGTLWALISPKSFRIKIKPGEKLLQIRLFYSDTRLNEEEMRCVFKTHCVLWSDKAPLPYEDAPIDDGDGSLLLSVDLRGNEGSIGYHARMGTQKAIEFSRRDYELGDFFEPIRTPPDGVLMLRRGDFYILGTCERVRVPTRYAGEIVPMDARAGEFRAHYAGFFDPGFGFGREGEVEGCTAVLEIRAFENLLLRHGQPIAKFIFEQVAELPDLIYGIDLGSHYAFQPGVRLGKQFAKV